VILSREVTIIFASMGCTDRHPRNARFRPVTGVAELSAIEASGAMAGSIGFRSNRIVMSTARQSILQIKRVRRRKRCLLETALSSHFVGSCLTAGIGVHILA
jgi:hypothetical protein